MTNLLDIRVLEPGTTEAQEGDVGNGPNAESAGHHPSEVMFIKFPAQQQVHPPVMADLEVRPGSAAHDQIQIGSLLDSRLRMREPLTLVMEQEGEFYIARCEELNEFGYGTDPISAVQDIRNTIAELYWELKENQNRLGSDLAQTWQILSDLVYEA